MIASAIIAGVSALSSLLGGIESKSESEKLAAKIRKQQLTVPEEVETMLGQAKTMSAMGMPGYEAYKEQIGELLPQAAQAARETVQSPSSLIDLYAKSMAESNRAYNQLAVQDATARRQNMMHYQNVLGNVAQMRTGIQQANIQTNLAALGQEAQGTKDLISGLSQAPATFLRGFVGMEQAGLSKDIEGLFNKNTPAQAPVLSPAQLNQAGNLPSEATFPEPTSMPTTQPNYVSQWLGYKAPGEATYSDTLDDLIAQYARKKFYPNTAIPSVAPEASLTF